MDHQLIRCFLAVELSESLKQEAQIFVEGIKTEYPVFRFIPSQNWHLTLHFFGDLSSAQAEEIQLRLPDFLGKTQPFSISLEHMGVFPDERKPRILWLGVSGDTSKLLALKKQVDQALKKLRFEIEKRPFHPHLTIARSKNQFSKTALNLTREFKTKTIDSIRHLTLFQRSLSPQGAVYTVLKTFPLSGCDR